MYQTPMLDNSLQEDHDRTVRSELDSSLMPGGQEPRSEVPTQIMERNHSSVVRGLGLITSDDDDEWKVASEVPSSHSMNEQRRDDPNPVEATVLQTRLDPEAQLFSRSNPFIRNTRETDSGEPPHLSLATVDPLRYMLETNQNQVQDRVRERMGTPRLPSFHEPRYYTQDQDFNTVLEDPRRPRDVIVTA